MRKKESNKGNQTTMADCLYYDGPKVSTRSGAAHISVLEVTLSYLSSYFWYVQKDIADVRPVTTALSTRTKKRSKACLRFALFRQ